MNRLLSTMVLAVSGVASLFVFNNCQGDIKPLPGSYQQSSSCISKSPKISSKVLRLKGFDSSPNKWKSSIRPFESAEHKFSSKALDSSVEVAVEVDLKCMQEKLKSGEARIKEFYQSLIKNKAFLPELKTQPFSYKIRDKSSWDEFNNILNQEECLLYGGMNWSYDLQATMTSFNDSLAKEQGHLNAIKLKESTIVFHNSETGLSPSDFESQVTVAVVDTGVAYTHKDLVNNMWLDENGYVGVNATTIGVEGLEEDRDPYDTSPYSHGTHVAGIVASESQNQLGVVGIADRSAKVMAIRAFNSIEGSPQEIKSTTVDVAAGIKWAIDRGAKIINLSVARAVEKGSQESFRDEILELAIQYAVEKDVFLVFAAGNAGGSVEAQPIDNQNFTVLPARYGAEIEGAVSVGSVDADTFEKSGFSHFGTNFIEMSAPGRDSATKGIFSLSSPIMVNNKIQDEYRRLEGTSMSSPMVAAAASLAYSMIKKHTGEFPSAAEVERLLMMSSAKKPQLQPYFKNGNTLDLSRLAVQIVVDYDLDVELGSLQSLVCE